MNTPHKGLHNGLAAAAGELQAAVRPVPFIKHEGHLSCYGAIRRQACKSGKPL